MPGLRIIIKTVIVSFYLVSELLCLSLSFSAQDVTRLSTGFSRGAYQVRALSAMIETVRTLCCPGHGSNESCYQVGLIHKGNGDQIPLCAPPHGY